MCIEILQKFPTKISAYANFFFAIVVFVLEIVLLVITKYREVEQSIASRAGVGIWSGLIFLLTGLIALQMRSNHRNKILLATSYSASNFSMAFALTLVGFSCSDIHSWLSLTNNSFSSKFHWSTINEAVGLRGTMLTIGFLAMAVNLMLSIKIFNRIINYQQSQ